MKILLVNNSPEMLSFAKRILADIGHAQVTEASDVPEAVSWIIADRPDLVLIDQNMPARDLDILKNASGEYDTTLSVVYLTAPVTAEALAEQIERLAAAVPRTE